jgi:hypothetical protein
MFQNVERNDESALGWGAVVENLFCSIQNKNSEEESKDTHGAAKLLTRKRQDELELSFKRHRISAPPTRSKSRKHY